MAGEKSKRPSRKTKTDKTSKKNKNKTPAKADKEPTRTGGGIQRLDLDQGLEKLPSNAPTMAIAPSDYEHIYHEGTNATAQAAHQPTSPQPPPGRGQEADSRRLPPPPPRSPQQADFANLTGGQQQAQSPQPVATFVPQNTNTNNTTNFEIQVTPDGYTLLGQAPLDPNSSSSRRVAFPSHIVRANNQFSRAALARIARYLASRSEL